MVDSSKEEQRALSQDELELVSAARQPGLREMSDRDLADLLRRLRDRRDRARTTGDRQAREIRGKAAPSGSTAAADNAGTRSKEHFLGAALARAMEERERRQEREHTMPEKERHPERHDPGHSDRSQRDIAEEALELRRKAEGPPDHPENTPTPDEGMQPKPNEGIAPSGALDAEGHKVVVERTRKPR